MSSISSINNKIPLIGAHVSSSGGVDKAASRAKKQGCEVMQLFVQSPHTFKVPETTPQEVERFLISLKKNKITAAYVHAPYLVNLASAANQIRHGSINLVRKNLDRASLLHCRALMTHLGSYGEETKPNGIKQVIKSISRILEGYKGSCELLLELSAGSGNIIGSRFEEIKKILKGLKSHKIGVCLDTAHIFASGYDLNGKKAIDRVIDEFNQEIGLNKLKLIHLNDSKVSLGSKKDRHADIGDGEIKLENIALILNHTKLRKIPMILETPGSDPRRKKDIDLLKKLRKSK